MYYIVILPHILSVQPDEVDVKPTNREMDIVAKVCLREERTSDLAREMEVVYDPGETIPLIMIREWVFYDKGTRYKLAEHLKEAGLRKVSIM